MSCVSFGDCVAYRLGAMADLRTMGMGKPTIKRSVITSLVPMVMS